MSAVERQHVVRPEPVPHVDAPTVPDVDIHAQNVNMWYEGGVGKKELGKPETMYMLQIRYDECTSDDERTDPQKGVWFYERSAAMRRNFKRNYPEFFAKLSDSAARRKRQERQKEAEETIRDRKRRGRDTGKIPAIRPEIVDFQAYRKRAGS